MGLETGTYINSLNSSWPDGSTDPRSEGDDHLKLIKSTLKNTFPNITGVVTPTHTELNYVYGVTSNIQTQLDNAVSAGDIKLTARATAPSGWLICDGSAVSRTTYAVLFAAIGTAYGAGDGSTTFNLPDGRGRTFIGAGTGPGLTTRTLAATVGTETHTLTTAETPLKSHNHGINDPGHTHTEVRTSHVGGGTVNYGGDHQVVTSNTGSSVTGISINLAENTAASAHNNMQPSIVGNWIIKT